MAPAEHAGAVGAHDVAQADQRDRPSREPRVGADVHQVGREVDGDERDVEAADEEAGDQEQVAAVAERAREGLLEAEVDLAGRGRTGRARGHGGGEQRHHGGAGGEQEECSLPAVGEDERLAQGRQQELAEAAGRGGDAHGPRAPLGRHAPGEGGHDDGERAAGEAQADQDAGGQVHLQRGLGHGHQRHARGVEQAAHGQHPRAAEPVGERPGERLARAPEQVLDRDREREHLAPPAVRLRDRDGEQPEAGADAEGEERDQAAAGDDHGGRAPAGSGRLRGRSCSP